jgi:hypothetical protein
LYERVLGFLKHFSEMFKDVINANNRYFINKNENDHWLKRKKEETRTEERKQNYMNVHVKQTMKNIVSLNNKHNKLTKNAPKPTDTYIVLMTRRNLGEQFLRVHINKCSLV